MDVENTVEIHVVRNDTLSLFFVHSQLLAAFQRPEVGIPINHETVKNKGCFLRPWQSAHHFRENWAS